MLKGHFPLVCGSPVAGIEGDQILRHRPLQRRGAGGLSNPGGIGILTVHAGHIPGNFLSIYLVAGIGQVNAVAAQEKGRLIVLTCLADIHQSYAEIGSGLTDDLIVGVQNRQYPSVLLIIPLHIHRFPQIGARHQNRVGSQCLNLFHYGLQIFPELVCRETGALSAFPNKIVGTEGDQDNIRILGCYIAVETLQRIRRGISPYAAVHQMHIELCGHILRPSAHGGEAVAEGAQRAAVQHTGILCRLRPDRKGQGNATEKPYTAPDQRLQGRILFHSDSPRRLILLV